MVSRRWAVAALSIVLLLVVAFLAFGALAHRGDGQKPDPGRVSQTVDGITVTVKPLYADGNRIVLSSTVAGGVLEGSGSGFVAWDGEDGSHVPKLTDDKGNSFAWLDGSFDGMVLGRGDAQPASDPTCCRRYSHDDLEMAFDTSAFNGAPPTLTLHLTLDAGSFEEGPVRVAGPFNFDLSVPYDALRRKADLHQTVVGRRGSLTLDRVTATRRETRAFLHFDPADANKRNDILPDQGGDIFLLAGGWTSQLGGAPVGTELVGREQDGWTYSFLTPTLALGRDWTLTVRNVHGQDFAPQDVVGPWVFHFSMPPAGAPPQVSTPDTLFGLPTFTPRPTKPTPFPPPPTPSVLWLPPGPMRTGGPVPGPMPTGPPVVTPDVVREHDFGAWSYQAVRNPAGRLYVKTRFDTQSVAGIRSFAAANRALAEQLARKGGQAEVWITFSAPMTLTEYAAWAAQNGITDVSSSEIEATNPQGTPSIFGVYDYTDPYSQLMLARDVSGYSQSKGPLTVLGIVSLRASVQAARLPALAASRPVAVADVTPNIIAEELLAAGVPSAEIYWTDRYGEREDATYLAMEQLGLENFR